MQYSIKTNFIIIIITIIIIIITITTVVITITIINIVIRTLKGTAADTFLLLS